MAKEAKARIKINKLLEESGWRFFDSPQGKANISLEVNAKLTERSLNDLGEDFEKTKNGFIDFLLLDEKSFQPAFQSRGLRLTPCSATRCNPLRIRPGLYDILSSTPLIEEARAVLRTSKAALDFSVSFCSI